LRGRGSKWKTGFTDPLIVSSLGFAIGSFEFWKECVKDSGIEEIGNFTVSISADYITKANLSGGALYEIVLPNSSVDAMLENKRNNITFLNYLRTFIAHCGFPGFSWEGLKLPRELKPIVKKLVPF
jgi:hypothetical protein